MNFIFKILIKSYYIFVKKGKLFVILYFGPDCLLYLLCLLCAYYVPIFYILGLSAYYAYYVLICAYMCLLCAYYVPICVYYVPIMPIMCLYVSIMRLLCLLGIKCKM